MPKIFFFKLVLKRFDFTENYDPLGNPNAYLKNTLMIFGSESKNKNKNWFN